jgi:hypothetical protein
MGIGDVHNKRDLYHTSRGYGNWKPAQLHSSRTHTIDELQLPADRVPGNAEPERGIRKPFKYRLSHNDSLGTAAACSSRVGVGVTYNVESPYWSDGSTPGDGV